MPETTDPIFEEAVKAHRTERYDLAEQLYREILSRRPDHSGALSNLGAMLAAQGKLREAAQTYQEAIQAAPNQPDPCYNLGNLLRRMGRLTEAEQLYRRAIAIDDQYARAHHNLGLILGQQGRWPEAVVAYQRSLALDPKYHETHNLLGQALLQCGDLPAAAGRFQRFTRLQPEDPRGYFNLGLTFFRQSKFDEALSAYDKALSHKGEYADALAARGTIFWKIGKIIEAMADWNAALKLQPTNPEHLANLAMVAEEAGGSETAAAILKRVMELAPQNPTIHSTYLRLLTCSSLPPESLAEEHRLWAKKFVSPNRPERPPLATPVGERILNIGYVFGAISPSEASSVFTPLLTCHQRTQVRVTGLFSLPEDEHNRCVAAACDHAIWMHHQQDQEVLSQIRQERIDILIDTRGHGRDSRLGLFVFAAAPLQVSWFGYPVTTGINTYDYRLTDAYLDPPGEATDQLYTEKLIRLPGQAFTYRPPQLPSPAEPPCLVRGFPTFGIAQSPRRILPGMIEVWARLLQQLPQARLRMIIGRNGFGRERFAELFAKLGIPADRVDLLPHREGRAYWAFWNEVDIALDAFPANGRLSTLDALWMGVPVVTLSGRASTSRVGQNLLRHAGLQNLTAWNPDQYIEIASQLTHATDQLRQLRANLRQTLELSNLANVERFTRNLEATYRGMARRLAGETA
jgi:protein O-GlcNAc transferase